MPGLTEPIVTISEAQAYVRIETGDEEAVVAGLIRTASALCEAFINQVVIARDFEIDLPASGAWERLPITPVRSIVSATTIDLNEAATPLTPGSYLVDVDFAGDGWLRLQQASEDSRVRVTGRAGLAESENGVPEPIRQGVLRLVAHLFTARDGEGGDAKMQLTASDWADPARSRQVPAGQASARPWRYRMGLWPSRGGRKLLHSSRGHRAADRASELEPGRDRRGERDWAAGHCTSVCRRGAASAVPSEPVGQAGSRWRTAAAVDAAEPRGVRVGRRDRCTARRDARAISDRGRRIVRLNRIGRGAAPRESRRIKPRSIGRRASNRRSPPNR
jgi:uncharacterized phiE125 gp8 family phage protein